MIKPQQALSIETNY